MASVRAILWTTLLLLIGSAGATLGQDLEARGLSTPPVSVPAAKPVQLQTGDDAKAADGESVYTVGIGDVIHVSVWKNTDLSQTVTIGPDGFVSLPLLGDVKVEGLTANQLRGLIAERLSAYVVSPQVTVSVVEIHSRHVYVLGEVGKPGGYPLVTPISVMQLIAEAGGFNTFANRNGIYVLRETNGHTQRYPFNYKSVMHGKNNPNIDLQPGDTVVVP